MVQTAGEKRQICECEKRSENINIKHSCNTVAKKRARERYINAINEISKAIAFRLHGVWWQRIGHTHRVIRERHITAVDGSAATGILREKPELTTRYSLPHCSAFPLHAHSPFDVALQASAAVVVILECRPSERLQL